MIRLSGTIQRTNSGNFHKHSGKETHNTVINRIEQNVPAIQRNRKENAVVVREQLRRAKEGKVNREVRIETPKSISHIVPANEVNRPKSEIKLYQRDIKTGERALRQVEPRRSREPERGIPAITNQPRQPSLPSRPRTTIPGLQTPQQRQEDQKRAQEQGRQQQLPAATKAGRPASRPGAGQATATPAATKAG